MKTKPPNAHEIDLKMYNLDNAAERQMSYCSPISKQSPSCSRQYKALVIVQESGARKKKKW